MVLVIRGIPRRSDLKGKREKRNSPPGNSVVAFWL